MKKLKPLFTPKSIAVIGASRNKNSVGYGILYNLLHGGVYHTLFNHPFKGMVYAINPYANKILGLKCYDSIKDIKERIDLAVIAVKANLVPKIIKECSEKKVKALIIISAGFAELNDEGKMLQAKICSIIKNSNMVLVGPNCLGIINTNKNLNASFAPAMPPKGPVSFISQSGALADSVIDWAIEKYYGLSKVISYGNAACLNINDFLLYLSKDKHTKAIAIYIESIKDGRKFMRIAKNIKKPIIVLKAGRTEKALKAVSSHTGNLAGSYQVYKVAFEQSNVYLADSVNELFNIAWVQATQPKLKSNSIAIITNGGGAGILAADACIFNNLKLAKLNKRFIKKLSRNKLMHPAWSRNNPIDLVGDALPSRYEIAINETLKQKNVAGLMVIQTLQTMTDPVANAKIIVKAKQQFPKKPIIAVYMGGKFTKPGKVYLKAHKVPVYNDINKATIAMKSLITNY